VNAKSTRSATARGVTIVELLVTIAVIAILTSIAYPAYQGQTRKSARAAAQGYMMDIAQREQQMFLDVRSYTGSIAALNLTAPDKVSNRYTVAVVVAAGPPSTFTVTATPVNSQIEDSCGVLSVNSAGTRLPADCW